LADDDAVLVIDETGFLKQGKASCGVARQYTGSAGKITNCQIGVFAAYVSRHGHAFIDRALYLPKEWTDDPVAWKPHTCPPTRLATKPKLATRMIARAIAALYIQVGLLVTPSMVLAISSSNCVEPAKATCSGSAARMCFDPGASGDRSPARPPTSPGRGARPTGNACRQGPEPKDRGCMTGVYLELPISRSKNPIAQPGLWTRGLLIRRHIADGDLAFFTTWCPVGTSIETLVAVEGHRWAIEDSFETAKNEFGLDHNETILAWVASPRLTGDARLRHDGGDPPSRQSVASKKTKRRTTAKTKASPPDIDPLVNPGNPPHRR